MLGKMAITAKLMGLIPTSPEKGPPLPQVLGQEWPAKVKEMLPPMPKVLAELFEKGKQARTK